MDFSDSTMAKAKRLHCLSRFRRSLSSIEKTCAFNEQLVNGQKGIFVAALDGPTLLLSAPY